jgi:hypothetical protein
MSELTAAERKERPIYTEVLKRFPNSMFELGYVLPSVSEREHLSPNNLDEVMHHLIEHQRGVSRDADGVYHLARAARRIIAQLEQTITQESK